MHVLSLIVGSNHENDKAVTPTEKIQGQKKEKQGGIFNQIQKLSRNTETGLAT